MDLPKFSRDLPEHGFEVLLTRNRIRAIVNDLADQVASEYEGMERIHGITVLNGARTFSEDLRKELKARGMPVSNDHIQASSYEYDESSRVPKITKWPRWNVLGQRVLLIEDIVDTGRTLDLLIKHLVYGLGAEAVVPVVLLDKHERREVPLALKYVGTRIPDRFAIGYGLDYNGKFRSLPDIWAKK